MSARVIEINGVQWSRPEANPASLYLTNYYKLVDQIKSGGNDIGWYRDTLLNDNYFWLYFVLKIPGYLRGRDGVMYPFAHHPFVIQACKEVQLGPRSHTLDLWARGHFKSTIITLIDCCQYLMEVEGARVALYSHSIAWCTKKFFLPIKRLFEESQFLKDCFPDRLYQEPEKEAWRWSDDSGLFLRGSGAATEASLGAYGLIDAMPTGGHFTKAYYDDIMVKELKDTPTQIEKLKDNFAHSLNLTTLGSERRIVGTTYTPDDIYAELRAARDEVTQKLLYETRVKPATVDGTYNGASVFLPEMELQELRAKKYIFASQQLLNPTPLENADLDPRLLRPCTKKDLPRRMLKFMLIDPAGQNKNRPGDRWAIAVIGVEPRLDDLGNANFYFLDLFIKECKLDDAMKEAVKMYLKHGRIAKIGVEKVALSTTEIHLKNALKAKKITVSVENKKIALVSPEGRRKEYRLIEAWESPLINGKVHVMDDVAPEMLAELKKELQTFPRWHDDGLDTFAFLQDVLRDYKFSAADLSSSKVREVDAWDRAWKDAEDSDTISRKWMSH